MLEINHKDWAARWSIFRANEVASKSAIDGNTLTYGQLNQKGEQLANKLVFEYGLTKGDRVAILAESCLEYLLFFVAAQKTGFILVPLNYRLATAELDYLLSDADPKLFCYQTQFCKVSATLQPTPNRRSVPMEVLFKETTAQSDLPLPEVIIEDDAPIFILYTSGTTGFPKGALYTHKMLFWNSVNTALSLLVNPDSRTLNVMPPFHTGGWNVLTTPFLHHGAYSCLLPRFEPKEVLRLLESEAVTIFMAVPTMLKMMADLEEFQQADFSQLLYIIVGGEAMPIPLIKRWQAKGVAIRQGYGMTEVGPNLTSLHQEDAIRKIGSIGKPNFYVNTKIVDPDNPADQRSASGELWLSGPMVSPGYWRNDAATQISRQGKWFKTGDLVRRDEEGYLYVVDRIKNMFISGGENVYPAEIERVLLQHPAIAEIAVIGVTDQQWGEVGLAFVVTAAGESLTAKQCQLFAKKQLAKFKIPKHFVFRKALPKNGTGKIDRKSLKITFVNDL